MTCTSKVLYCRAEKGRKVEEALKLKESQVSGAVYRQGAVEGKSVMDILLDTGCSRMLVREDLVPTRKILEKKVTIRCAHGNTVCYPLAEVELLVGGRRIAVEAGISKTLPASVLLGTDVPQMMDLLMVKDAPVQPNAKEDEALAVTTRAQARQQAEEAIAEQQKRVTAGMKPTSIEEEEVPEQEVPATKDQRERRKRVVLKATDEELIGSEFSADLFTKNVIRT